MRTRTSCRSLRATGCAFVTSAVESVDDEILVKLEKGHTAADFERAVGLCRDAGLVMSPTFVAFTPWTTARRLLRAAARRSTASHSSIRSRRFSSPSGCSSREGSRLLELEEIQALVGPFDARSLTYRWVHRDPEVDRLQEAVASLVGRRLNASRRELFDEIWETAHEIAALRAPSRQDPGLLPRAAVPYLNEPWYC